MGKRQYCTTKLDLEEKLEAARGKTLGEVDSAHVFEITKANPKVTGIAGDVVEQSVIGYPANSDQEPDLIVDGEEVELKTTGLRKSKKMKGLEAKEPMSVTAVSLNTIAQEEFETSNFWRKVKSTLFVYYLYDSPVTVRAADYASFPICGYQFHRFSGEEEQMLRNDWELVRDFVKRIQDENPDEADRERLYPRLSSALRDQLMLIDTAPKYPNPPRFRLKRSTVTAIARKNFGEAMEQLPKSYTSYAQIDAVLHSVAERFHGRTLGELAQCLGIPERINKGSVERIVAKMFGSDSKHMAQVELFAKAGIKAKSIVLRKDGKRTEDMKLFRLQFEEFYDPNATFENSPIREYFAEGSIICIVLEEPNGKAPLEENRFLGFKRVSFDDEFVDTEVKRTYEEIADLIRNRKLRIVPKVNKKTGKFVINKTGVAAGAPNFPKSHDHLVFVRGTSSDSTRKPEHVNGIAMYGQQIWVKGSYMAKRLAGLPWI